MKKQNKMGVLGEQNENGNEDFSSKKPFSQKNKSRKSKRFVFVCVSRFFLVCLLVGLLLFFPLAKILYNEHGDQFSEKFFGKESEFQGIIRLWNIDSFEGGCLPKTNFLEKMSRFFESKNKGVFFMIQNMTEDEVVSSIKAGTYPDMICFGTGMNKYFNGKLVRLDDSIAVSLLPNFYGAGLQNGKLVAVPIMAGAYCLISSSERIEKTGKNKSATLSNLAFALATDTQRRKGVVHTNSLTFGVEKYVSALDAFSRKFVSSSAVTLAENGILDKNYVSQNQYSAYESFVLGKSNMLLGTQRDVFRMINRENAGKETGAMFEPIKEFSDLVQYAGILSTNKTIVSLCTRFITLMLEPENQKLLSDIGMFSVTGQKIYDKIPFSEIEKIFDDKIAIKSCL